MIFKKVLVALVPFTICLCEKNVDFVDVCETQGISMVLCFLSMQSTTCLLFRRRRLVSNNDAVVFDVFFLTLLFLFLKCPEVRLGSLFLVGRPTARCPEVGLDFWFLRCPEVELEI